MLRIFPQIFFEGEGAGAGGGAGGGAAGGAAGGASGGAPGANGNLGGGGSGGGGDGGAAGGAGAGAAWKLPDGVPDHLKADDAGGFATKLFEDWGKQRTALSKVPAAPKDVSEYQFTPSDKVKPFLGDLSKDPVFNVIKEVSLKAGIPAAAFNTQVAGFYEALVEKGLAPAPYDPVKQRAAFLGDGVRGMNEQQQIDTLKPILDGAQGFINSLIADKSIEKDTAQEFMGLLDTAAGLKGVVALQKLMASKGLGLGGNNGGGSGMTHDTLKARQADPRNDSSRQEYNRDFAAETDRMYRGFFK